MTIYVDPYMSWCDTRILVGRKGTIDGLGCTALFKRKFYKRSKDGFIRPQYSLFDVGSGAQNYFTFHVTFGDEVEEMITKDIVNKQKE